MTANWYAVSTHPNQEGRAETNLRRQGYETWCPRYRKIRSHARRREAVLAPFFPGYLFVMIDLNSQGWGAINSTFGVRYIVCQGKLPSRVPPDFVESLQLMEEGQGYLDLPSNDLKCGDCVRITTGPFAEMIGTLVGIPGRDRVSILLDMLGRAVEATVLRDHLVAAV